MSPVFATLDATWMKLAAVMSLDSPLISFQRVTFLSGIFHKRSLPSREALKKNCSIEKQQ